MADLDTALDEALALLDPTWTPPDTSAFMQRQRAELTDWDEPEYSRDREAEDDEADDFTHDDSSAEDGRPRNVAASVSNDPTASG